MIDSSFLDSEFYKREL